MKRALAMAVVVLASVVLTSASPAYEIKPRTPDSAFSGKLQPDILGLSSNIDASKAGSIFESHARELGVAPQATQQKFGSSNITYVSVMRLDRPAAPDHAAESLSAAFSSPASGNLAYFISRDLGFLGGQQPTKAEMIQRVIDKYGTPTLIGDGVIYFFYKGGKLVSVKQKYTPANAADALNAPIAPRAAVALNDANGHGSCVAMLKRAQALTDRSLDQLNAATTETNCDGLVAVGLSPGTSPDRVGKAVFTVIDFKLATSAAKIDSEALAAQKNDASRNSTSNAPKL
ncbi:MAG: hypothetical protein EKK40_12725 [Bradyrhizobiaceae bacterium]|nr:MAG: hypothetical protein EKK40_12725 [Bradyrhizobiaceae bacterium]